MQFSNMVLELHVMPSRMAARAALRPTRLPGIENARHRSSNRRGGAIGRTARFGAIMPL